MPEEFEKKTPDFELHKKPRLAQDDEDRRATDDGGESEMLASSDDDFELHKKAPKKTP